MFIPCVHVFTRSSYHHSISLCLDHVYFIDRWSCGPSILNKHFPSIWIMGDHNNVSWYAYGIFFSILTPSLLYVWNCCCGHACAGVHSFIFKLVAEKFDVEEHRFDCVSNLGAMSRVLRQAGLRSGRFRWNHDANADSGDAVQVGTLFLPTQSYSLWTLALLGITHYIWIKDDCSVIVMTAPRVAVEALVRLSNSIVNRQATTEEIAELMVVFSSGHMELQFRLVDRVAATASLAICAVSFLSCQAAYLKCGGFLVSVFLWLRLGRNCWHALARCKVYVQRLHQSSRSHRVREADTAELSPSLLEATTEQQESEGTSAADASIVDEVSSDISETLHEVHATSEEESFVAVAAKRYCVVIARVDFYEIQCQQNFEPDVFDILPLHVRHAGVKAVAVEQTVDMLNIVINSFHRTEELLYVCVHNPMTDLHILEMRELLVKATRDIMLLIILPAVSEFSAILERPFAARLHARKDSRYVATLADMYCWITTLNSRVFPNVMIVLPYYDRELLQASELWKLFQRTVNSEVWPVL